MGARASKDRPLVDLIPVLHEEKLLLEAEVSTNVKVSLKEVKVHLEVIKLEKKMSLIDVGQDVQK